MKVQYYKSNHGIFFSAETNYYNNLSNYIINGTDGKIIPKYGSYWLIKADELKFQRKVAGRTVKTGWKLKNSKLESVLLPINLSLDSIVEDYDEDDNLVHRGNFGEFASLYELTYETLPASIEDVEINLVLLGELQIDNLSKPEETKVKLVQGSFGGQAQTVDLSSIVLYEDLTKIVVPGFMLHNHPCSLSSKQVYEIVRAYVKENINPRTAKISSDYDFCFAVQKVFTTAKPINVSKEVKKANGRSYSTPRFTTVKANTSSLQIFEMTWAGYSGKAEGYSGYTAIAPWKADNLEDMKQQVKVYLENLMSVLNAESKECGCCKGTGFIFETKETK